MNTIEFANKLKEQRILKGESPSELGQLLGVGVKQINRYENGELPPPHESLELLCKHYKYDFISLLYDFKVLIPGPDPGKSTKIDDILERLLQEKDLVALKIEEKAKLAEVYASEMKQHYEDAKVEKAKMLDIIDNTLKEISSNLKETATSLKSNRDFLLAIGRTVRANDAEMMEALDHLEGNPAGTRQKRSHTVQKALREGVEAKEGDKKTDKNKIHKDMS